MKIQRCRIFNLNSKQQAEIEIIVAENPDHFRIEHNDVLIACITGHNSFQRIKNLNYALQTHAWILLCNGARFDAHMSGMLSDSSNGESVYVGRPDYNTPIMSIFDPAPVESIKIYDSGQNKDGAVISYLDLIADAPYIMRKKQNWIIHYLQFREKKDPIDSVTAKNYLNSVGKNSSELALRFRGCLLGLAVCDALGTTLEFAKRDSATITDMIGGGPYKLMPGQWTDDTSMALCSAESLIANQGFNPKSHMALFKQWRDTGKNSSKEHCFDIGYTVNAAISNYVKYGTALAGPIDPKSAGNGSLMRIAPDILFHFFSAYEIDDIVAVSSRITHGAIEAVDACRYFGALLHGVMAGRSKQELLAGIYYPEANFWEDRPLCESINNIANGSFKFKDRSEIKSSGYVVDTLEAALWAFYATETFKEGALLAVNLAGDADTIGAVYGQIAGAYYMEPQIPISWLNKLYQVERFFDLADELLEFACSNYQPTETI